MQTPGSDEKVATATVQKKGLDHYVETEPEEQREPQKTKGMGVLDSDPCDQKEKQGREAEFSFVYAGSEELGRGPRYR